MNSYCSDVTCRRLITAGGLCVQCDQEFCVNHWGYRGPSIAMRQDGVWRAEISPDAQAFGALCAAHAQVAWEARVDAIWAGLAGRPVPNTIPEALQLVSIGNRLPQEVTSLRPIAPPACIPAGIAELWRRSSAGDQTPVEADQIYGEVARILANAGRVPPEVVVTEHATTWRGRPKTQQRTVRAWRIVVGHGSSGYDTYTIYGHLFPDGRHDGGRSSFRPNELPSVAGLVLSLLQS